MKLMMYLRNDLIEAISLDASQVSKPGYLGAIKRGLKEKYQALLTEAAEPAEFLVIGSDGPAQRADESAA